MRTVVRIYSKGKYSTFRRGWLKFLPKQTDWRTERKAISEYTCLIIHGAGWKSPSKIQLLGNEHSFYYVQHAGRNLDAVYRPVNINTWLGCHWKNSNPKIFFERDLDWTKWENDRERSQTKSEYGAGECLNHDAILVKKNAQVFPKIPGGNS